ncbi:hypothetical protein, partial [uncultured Rikenella sp.]
WLGWIFGGRANNGREPHASRLKITAQRNKAERTRGRPNGTTSAKVFWVPFLQKRYGSIRLEEQRAKNRLIFDREQK